MRNVCHSIIGKQSSVTTYILDIFSSSNWHTHFYNINVFITSAMKVRWFFKRKLSKLEVCVLLETIITAQRWGGGEINQRCSNPEQAIASLA